MDINPIFNYKNAEIELVVEDDVITTAKVYMDGECVYADDTLTDENGKDLKYTPKNRTAVVRMCAMMVDRELAEDGREECTNMSLIKT
jgi:hypothetical protein